MKYNKLRVLAEADIKKRYEKDFVRIETEEGLKEVLTWHNKTYKNNAKDKIKRFLESRQKKEIEKELNLISEIENSKDFTGEFIITIEWVESRTWGKNPKAYTNYGFNGSYIGGCGYDKLSTATAEALNSHKPILKRLYARKELLMDEFKGDDLLNGFNRSVLGYGSGYGVLPRFEGGVGVRSHEEILNNIGLEMRNITSTKSTDVYLIKVKP